MKLRATRVMQNEEGRQRKKRRMNKREERFVSKGSWKKKVKGAKLVVVTSLR
jgi:hypothetical protein